MTKTLNQIIFVFLHQNQNIFFQQHWESEYYFWKKNYNLPPLQVKWSFPNTMTTKKKDNMTNNDLKNIAQKTKD